MQLHIYTYIWYVIDKKKWNVVDKYKQNTVKQVSKVQSMINT
jgi:hypothetical protein